jgi:hypothetical protein
MLAVTPGGWINAAWWLGWMEGVLAGWLALIPMCILWYQALKWRRHFFDKYAAAETRQAATHSTIDRSPSPSSWAFRRFVAWLDWVHGNVPSAEPGPMPIDQAQRRIRTGEFLDPPIWPRSGWLERAADRLLTPREKLVVDLLSCSGPRWTKTASRLLLLMIVIAIVNTLLPAAGPIAAIWLMPATILLPLFASCDSRLVITLLPDLAAFPIFPREVVSVMLKIALVRWLMLLVVVLLGIVAISGAVPTPTQLVLALVPFVCWAVIVECWRAAFALMTRFEAPTLRWRRCYWVALSAMMFIGEFVSFFGLVLLCGLAGFDGNQAAWDWLGVNAILSVGMAVSNLWLALAVYYRGRCDLAEAKHLVLTGLNLSMRRSRRFARRRQFGSFWWLPRHVPAADRGVTR